MTGVNSYHPQPYDKLEHPEWSKNATISKINTRQFTADGTFRAAEEHLPRIKALGAVILWLWPIHEIGLKNRKGYRVVRTRLRITTALILRLERWPILITLCTLRTSWECM